MKLFAASTVNFPFTAREELSAAGYEVVFASPDQAPEDACADLSEFEVAFFELPYLKKHLSKFPGLKLVQTMAASADSLPEDLPEGLTVCSTGGFYGKPVAEWCVGKVLDVLRQTRLFAGYQQEKRWSWDGSLDSRELWGSTAVILGTGTVGCECARRLAGFQCRLIGMNIDGSETPGFETCVSEERLDWLLSQADEIICTLPLTERTRGMLSAERLKKIKPGAVLVSVSPGGIIEEDALCEALENGTLAGAALDGFETEPLPADSPLWDQAGLSVFPHSSRVSETLRALYLSYCCRNAANFASGAPLSGVIRAGADRRKEGAL